jgi:TolB protein
MLGIGLKLHRLVLLAVSVIAFLQTPAYAQLTIEITGAGANRIPVAIADFGGDPGSSRTVTSVIRADLERSGLFKMIDPGAQVVTDASSPVLHRLEEPGC